MVCVFLFQREEKTALYTSNCVHYWIIKKVIPGLNYDKKKYKYCYKETRFMGTKWTLGMNPCHPAIKVHQQAVSFLLYIPCKCVLYLAENINTGLVPSGTRFSS
jgi:hypothetical protein